MKPFYPTFSRLLLPVFLLLLTTSKGNAQTYVTIPDTVFRDWLSTEYPSCMNGDQLDITCTDVTSATIIQLYSLPIVSLEGIQYFTSLQQLQVSCYQLTTIPAFPPNLDTLHIGAAMLTNLPALPVSLTILQCSNNQLQALPELPATLEVLICAGNALTALPELPGNLKYLQCNNNQLTSLPEIPASMIEIVCFSNQISSIPELPETLQSLQCFDNPITCFHNFPYGMTFFDAENNLATCVPEYAWYLPQELSSLPLCQDNDPIFNPSGCEMVTRIFGAVFSDQSGDCTWNPGENDVPNVPVRLYDTNGNFLALTYTGPDGSYAFGDIGPADYIVALDTNNAPFVTNCSADSLVTVGQGITDSVLFSINCDAQPDLGIAAILPSGSTFPGQPFYVAVYAGDLMALYPLNCADSIPATLVVTLNGPVVYQSVAPGTLAPSQVNGNILTFEFPNATVSYYQPIQLVLLTDTLAQSSDSILVSAVISTSVTEQTLLNNTASSTYSIFNSYDPNYKEAYPSIVPSTYVEPITYTIHFQNTGTASALNIRLSDSLASQLDPASFEFIASSHPVITSLSGNLLTFRFNDINLADSTSNEPGSHGFVQYRIRPNAGLPLGTVIPNAAYIYFDYNEPILTNTATTTYYDPLSLEDLQKNLPVLYPNPAHDKLAVVYGKTFETLSISIRDLSGRILQTQTFHSGEALQLSIAGLSDGYYLLSLVTDNSTEPVVISFVKE